MPEVRFQITWPDNSQASCYSPSLIVKEYFAPDTEYDLVDFVERSRKALNIASDRIKAKYGFPCGLALGQIQEIEAKAAEFAQLDKPKVKFIKFNN
ncbi:MAG: MSMEG_0570 family nitrogen starvation response protein [Pseudanabaena frigida]|uniref:MSMEG_0570 family nitrogen starvation response protein n=1 Tax=Pseudanabaena frigida TaxID=945775 RepID=A0A2W4XKS2_9CYAN|nr:MAG: MSMEG_0570 family nitrogen starvation response protein [Pseudanabaena frigida]